MTGIILTGVDRSETALRAAEKAASLAQALHTELHVISAFSVDLTRTVRSNMNEHNPSATVSAVKRATEVREQEAQETAEAVVAQLAKKFGDVAFVARAAEGSPSSVLVREAQEHSAEVIVVGNKRVQGASRILGSIARSVAADAPCDVYIAHTHER